MFWSFSANFLIFLYLVVFLYPLIIPTGNINPDSGLIRSTLVTCNHPSGRANEPSQKMSKKTYTNLHESTRITTNLHVPTQLVTDQHELTQTYCILSNEEYAGFARFCLS